MNIKLITTCRKCSDQVEIKSIELVSNQLKIGLNPCESCLTSNNYKESHDQLRSVCDNILDAITDEDGDLVI